MEIHKFPSDWDYLRIRASSIWVIMDKINNENMPWDGTNQQAVIEDAVSIVRHAVKEGIILPPEL